MLYKSIDKQLLDMPRPSATKSSEGIILLLLQNGKTIRHIEAFCESKLSESSMRKIERERNDQATESKQEIEPTSCESLSRLGIHPLPHRTTAVEVLTARGRIRRRIDDMIG